MPKAAQPSLFKADTLPTGIIPLSELIHGQESNFFALLSAKEELTTRDGKPYFRVAFRDAGREVSFPLWNDTAWSTACREQWTVGEFYKLKAQYRETNYGPQLEIRKIRAVTPADEADGFSPAMCLPRSRFDPVQMFDDLTDLVKQSVPDEQLAEFVLAILQEHRDTLLTLPAAKYHHHAQVGGFLEHVLNVARTCVYFAEKYAEVYPDLRPPLDKGLVVAGGVLHDIGKIRELELTPGGAEYTASGSLIGHIVQGRDIIREAAAEHPLDADKLLRLEHIIISHQAKPEWGSPKEPMTPEALLVHYADDCDAKLQMMANALMNETGDVLFTTSRNPLQTRIYRGGTA